MAHAAILALASSLALPPLARPPRPLHGAIVEGHAAVGISVFRGTLTNEENEVYRVFLKSARCTAIRRNVKIKGEANPHDPSWELYYQERLSAKMCNSLTGSATARYLRWMQDGKCGHCQEPLTLEEGWHIPHLHWRSHGGPDTFANRVLPRTATGKFTARAWWL